MDKLFTGVCAVAVTPFNKYGNFDFEAAKENLDYLIESGVHGVCILGATSEYMSVTNEEHKEYVREMVPYVKGRIKIIVGATRERPEDVIDLIANAKEAGADCAMVLPPPYCHPSQEEIVENYRYIARETDLPLMVYNNPGSAGVDISRESFRKLFEIEKVMLTKESTGDIRRMTEILTDSPRRISVLCGVDNLSYESFLAGADGWVSMLANVAPKDCVALYKAVCEDGEYEKAFEIYKRILPALDFLESFSKPVQSLKYVLTRNGFIGGYVRKPRLELTEEEKQAVIAGMNPDSIS